ncbi:MAG: zinc ribbon domain-containing protein [Anaerosomatales bacterium]|nr:zinc ribbon domain-containing protein [Anaerosomatales bacterium]
MDTQAPRFCTSCGAPVNGARFCTSCGAALAAPAAAPPETPVPAPLPTPVPAAQPVASGERVVATVGGLNLKAGLLKRESATIVVTDRRVIVAKISKEMMKQVVADARDSAKAGGKGFLGQIGAQMSAWSGWAERYLAMSPDEVMAENADNVSIDRAQVTKVSFKHGHAVDDGATSTPDRIVLKTGVGKFDFELMYGDLGQAKRAFRSAGLA